MTVEMAQTGAADAIPVMRPKLPTAEQLQPYLERIDRARYYSNHGALLHELQDRLAAHFRVDPGQLAVVANGTVALSAALIAVGAKPGSICLLPSWTFVASAAAAWAANLRPHFVDVSPETWTIDPQKIARRADLRGVGAVMAVSAYGAPLDTQAWDDFTAQTGIPAIIDGAASFDTVATIPSARPGKSPIMISLHPTKVFGVGEGGLVVSTDRAVMQRFNQICNFGVWGEPEGQILGYNGKLSEYHAAIGLAFLDGWPQRRALLEDLTRSYASVLSNAPQFQTSPGYGEGWVSCYCNVATDNAALAIERLSGLGISTRRWWQSGVHAQRAYREFSRDELPVTEYLGTRVFGLPFFHDMTGDQFERICKAIGVDRSPVRQPML
jgi:dTDP-4-amino-4,6-dideoxygalactose transaminase